MSADDRGRYDGTHLNEKSLRATYLLFLGMGLATLLPWNLFISASEFFKYQFSGSRQEYTFQNWFSVTYMVITFLSTVYAMLTVNKSNPNTRILSGLIANTVVYIVGIALPFMRGLRGSISFYIAITQLGTTAITSGLLMNSVFALVAHFPAVHSEGILSGQAIAGVLATVAQLVAAYTVSPPSINPSFDDEAPDSADGLVFRTVAYFSFVAAVNLGLTYAFCSIRRDPYYQQQSKLTFPVHTPTHDQGSETERLIPLPALPATPSPTSDVSALKDTFHQISGYVYVVILDFALTLSVYPSVTSLVSSTDGFKLLSEWHFFMYNAGDLLGRRIAPSLRVTRVRSLIFLGLLRLLFIPVFFSSNVSYSVWPNWMRSDGVFLFLILLLGTGNGYLSTRAAMMAPGVSSNPTIAGSIIAIAVSSGLALGSVLSWPVRSLGCLCLPF
ncbi:hypothetical protein H4R20_006165 [Coemansia guatemalensis]|uniref:Nucleoside transporter n=1 Tax=Coemansia guatemalensis TaxID=2761395 RepID=A0A9W8HQ15_9FUNG|nr:hypothetical protein H4R20_006165 [Coemansia guatemalensis]